MTEPNQDYLATFYIVRHGENQLNIQGKIQGHTDSPLTKTGEKQARQIAQKLKNIHFAAIFSSDSLRAKRTAEIITLERKIAVQATAALRERYFGEYEGQPYENYNQALQKLLTQYKKVADDKYFKLQIGTAETIDQSTNRFITFLREIANSYSNKTVLLVTHGSIIKYFLTKIGYAPLTAFPFGAIANTALIILQSNGVDFFVKKLLV